MRYEITVGWTLNERDNRDYISFSDGYREGAPQHEVSLTIPEWNEVEPTRIAEAVFYATNSPTAPVEDSLEDLIFLAIERSGWTGRVDDENLIGHYSLSVGDTVTVNGVKLECQSFGWGEVNGK